MPIGMKLFGYVSMQQWYPSPLSDNLPQNFHVGVELCMWGELDEIDLSFICSSYPYPASECTRNCLRDGPGNHGFKSGVPKAAPPIEVPTSAPPWIGKGKGRQRGNGKKTRETERECGVSLMFLPTKITSTLPHLLHPHFIFKALFIFQSREREKEE